VVPTATTATWALSKSVAEKSIGSQAGVSKVLHSLACLLDISEAAAGCIHACRGIVQLLGCGNLGCTTLPPDGLGFAQDDQGLNCRESVCGGCGVVRYCSAVCAQQDWPQHRRVCRRLAAAAAASAAAATQA
jgi:hypothetical protein